MDNRIATYQTTDTMTTSQVDLVIKVYDGTIGQFALAISSYEKNDIATAIDHMDKARNALTHLYTTLDFEQGGDIAKNLGELYVFMINQTNLAAATGDRGFIEKNIELLRNLREGWVGIRAQQPQSSQSSRSDGHTPNSFNATA